MNYKFLNEAINLVDDDLISNVYCSSENFPKNTVKKILLSAAAISLVLLAALVKYNYSNRIFPSEIATSSSTDRFYGGEHEIYTVSNEKAEITGEGFTGDEIKKFIEKNKYDIIGAIAAEYDKFDTEYRISASGYSHISLGEVNELNLSILTLPVSVGNDVVANVKLLKSNGNISYSIETGDTAAENLNKALINSRNNELLFFYADGYTEIAIDRNNDVYIIKGNGDICLDTEVDYFKIFKTEYNCFSLSELSDENKCIKIVPKEEERVSVTTQNEDEVDEIYQTKKDLSASNTVSEISINDIDLSAIVSVEWNNSYGMTDSQEYKMCNPEQQKEIVSYISCIDDEASDSYDKKFGAEWYVKLTLKNGDLFVIVLTGEEFYIKKDDIAGKMYTDVSGNTVSLIYYLASLK